MLLDQPDERQRQSALRTRLQTMLTSLTTERRHRRRDAAFAILDEQT